MTTTFGQSILIEPLLNHQDFEFSIIKEKATILDKIWNFDEKGNIIILPRPNELPLDYFILDKIYIQIQALDIDQDNFLPMTVYVFEIFKYGHTDNKSSITNNLAYTDIRDCLDSALYFIENYKHLIEDYYNNTGSEIPLSAEILNIRGEILGLSQE